MRRPHGGVLLYVHNSLPISETFCYDDDTCEAVVCSIKSINTKIASIYRPPNTDDKSFENLLSFLEKALYDKNSRDKHPDIIIAGDFNIPEINWKAHHIHCENKLSSKAANRLLSFMEKHFLNQYISQPTREKNILDPFLTNNCNLVLSSTAENCTLSDHNIVKVKTTYNIQSPSVNNVPKIPEGTFRSLDLHRAHYEKINSDLEKVYWDELKELCTPDEFPELLRLTILQICMIHSQLKTITPNRQQMNPYARERRILRRRRKKIRAQIKVKMKLNPTAKKAINSQSRTI